MAAAELSDAFAEFYVGPHSDRMALATRCVEAGLRTLVDFDSVDILNIDAVTECAWPSDIAFLQMLAQKATDQQLCHKVAIRFNQVGYVAKWTSFNWEQMEKPNV